MDTLKNVRRAMALKEKMITMCDNLIETLMKYHIEQRPADQETDVHTEHCCAIHGCKYRDDDCTVETGKLIQSYPCESCGPHPYDQSY